MKKFFNLTALLIITVLVQAQTPVQKMDALLQAYTDQYKFYGTALVAKGDSILLHKGYGYKNAEVKSANDAASVFQIGSITKQFTAAVILRLQEEGKLSVKDKVSKYFPKLPNADKITIHQLLTHTSGLFNYTNDARFMQSDAVKPANREAMFSLFKDKPLDFEPGAKYNYSNSGYLLLGYIIEDVTKKKYEQVVREIIFNPLKMTNTGFDFTRFSNSNKTTGYYFVSETNSAVAPIVDSTVAFAAGAIYTTAADLFKWQRAIAGGKILKPASWKAAMTAEKEHYAYGLVVDSLYGQQRIHHGGGIFGYVSYAALYPKDGYTIILLSNNSAPGTNKIATDLAGILYNQPYELPKKNEEIKLSDEVLKQYIGEYQLAPAFSITMTLKDNYLYGQATGQQAFQMFPKKENRFFLKAVEAEVEFVKDASGAVTEMILFQGGREMKGKKVK